jgi:NAD(P)H-flavin reductase
MTGLPAIALAIGDPNGDLEDPSGWQVYACGNPVMIAAAKTDLTRMGLPRS